MEYDDCNQIDLLQLKKFPVASSLSSKTINNENKA